MLSLLIVSALRRDMVKCADNQNSIWFIFSPHGYPVYMNIKHEMQLVAVDSVTCQAITLHVCLCVCVFTQLGFRFVLIVSVHVFPSKSFLRVKLYVHCGLGVWLFLKANAEEISQTF